MRRRGLFLGEAAVGLGFRFRKFFWGIDVLGVFSYNLEVISVKLDSWWVIGRTFFRGYFIGWRLKWLRDCVFRDEFLGFWLGVVGWDG